MPTDPAAWLPLFNQYGFPLVSLLLCGLTMALFVVRYAWPFVTKELWPHYQREHTAHYQSTIHERDRLIASIDAQRDDSIGSLDRMRDAFSIQLESRSQELLALTREIGNITGAVGKLTNAIDALCHRIETLGHWDGLNDRRKR